MQLRTVGSCKEPDRLIRHIYTVTGMLGLFGALPDGAGGGNPRLCTPRSLTSGWRGLFDFTVFLRRLRG